jgi:HPt (histidine-containing phosphotransfer) domain-containing protein
MLSGVAPELDLRRLVDLQKLLGQDLTEIVATLIWELDSALESTERALDAGDLAAAALAAHAARNSALMIDAQPLLAELEALESSARHGDADGAAQAGDRLTRSWPSLRFALDRAAEQKPEFG